VQGWLVLGRAVFSHLSLFVIVDDKSRLRSLRSSERKRLISPTAFRVIGKRIKKGPGACVSLSPTHIQKRITKPVDIRTFLPKLAPNCRRFIQSICATRQASGPCPASIPPPTYIAKS
jgi:hypothetical protein